MRRPVAFLAVPSGGDSPVAADHHMERAALLQSIALRRGCAPILLSYAIEGPDMPRDMIEATRACAESIARTIGADTSSELWILLRDGAAICDGTVSGYAIEWHRGRGNPISGPGSLLRGRGVRSGTWADWSAMAIGVGLEAEHAALVRGDALTVRFGADDPEAWTIGDWRTEFRTARLTRAR